MNTTNKIISLFAVLIVPAAAGGASDSRAAPPITMIVQFQGPCVRPVFDAMKREFEFAMEDLGSRFEWVLFDEAAGSVFSRLMVVRLYGDCEVAEPPRAAWRPGPLGLAHMTDGQILPFVEVYCDRVRDLLMKNPPQSSYVHTQLLFGRALGRVLAHEVYHVLAGSARHAPGGLAKENLTAADLAQAGVRFAPADVAAMRGGLGVPAASFHPHPSPSPRPVSPPPAGLRRTLR